MATDCIVHIIDDDDAVRDSLSALLEGAGFSVCAYPSAAAFLDGIDKAPGGVVVTDVRMPGMSGLELLQRLRGRRPAVPVIVITGEADVAMAVEALKGGALEFIEKPYDGVEMIAAIRGAVERMGADRAQSSERDAIARRIAALSPRERDVLDGLVQGRTNKEIARDLGISPRTVEAYRSNLMTKTRTQSLSELVRMVLAVEA